jgi:cytochrome c peroxidase
LRNVALTAPYFHDGTAKTLEDAVRVMTQYQLGRELSERETRLLVKFLHTLTGEYKGKSLAAETSQVAQQAKP